MFNEDAVLRIVEEVRRFSRRVRTGFGTPGITKQEGPAAFQREVERLFNAVHEATPPLRKTLVDVPAGLRAQVPELPEQWTERHLPDDPKPAEVARLMHQVSFFLVRCMPRTIPSLDQVQSLDAMLNAIASEIGQPTKAPKVPARRPKRERPKADRVRELLGGNLPYEKSKRELASQVGYSHQSALARVKNFESLWAENERRLAQRKAERQRHLKHSDN